MPKKPLPAAGSGLPKSNRRRCAKQPNDLNAFVHAVLEPMSEAELIDTHYNRIVRQVRREAWRRAEAETNYFMASHAYVLATGNYYRHEKIASLKATAEIHLFDTAKAVRAAMARQILTPAYDRAGLAWKRKVLSDELKLCEPFHYLPITREETEAAIAADEAFLTAHPVSRARAKASGENCDSRFDFEPTAESDHV